MSSSRTRPVTRQTTQQEILIRRKHSVQHRYIHILYKKPLKVHTEPFPDTSCAICDPILEYGESFANLTRRLKKYDRHISLSAYNQKSYFRFKESRQNTIENFRRYLETLTFWRIPTDFDALAKYIKNGQGNLDDLTEVAELTEQLKQGWYTEADNYLLGKIQKQTSQFLNYQPTEFPATPAAQTYTPLQKELQNQVGLQETIDLILGNTEVSDNI